MRERLYFSSYSRKLGDIGYRVGALVKGREPVEGGRGVGGVGGSGGVADVGREWKEVPAGERSQGRGGGGMKGSEDGGPSLHNASGHLCGP